MFTDRVDSRGRVQSEVSELDFGNDALGKLFKELKLTTERIGQHNDYLERMASRLNHELRTPLNSVIGNAQLLSRADLPNKYRVQASDIATAGNLLLVLINDILDFNV